MYHVVSDVVVGFPAQAGLHVVHNRSIILQHGAACDTSNYTIVFGLYICCKVLRSTPPGTGQVSEPNVFCTWACPNLDGTCQAGF